MLLETFLDSFMGKKYDNVFCYFNGRRIRFHVEEWLYSKMTAVK